MLKRFIKDTDGVAALEFAFILPILVVLATMTIQFGWGIYVNHELLDAVRSTTRSVSVGEVELENATAALTSRMNLNIPGLTVQAILDEDETNVTITASIPKANVSIADILGLFQSGNLTASSTMRLE